MRIHPDVKMLAVVVVLFLAVGVSHGVILSKCELKQQLERGLTLQIPNPADVLAQRESLFTSRALDSDHCFCVDYRVNTGSVVCR